MFLYNEVVFLIVWCSKKLKPRFFFTSALISDSNPFNTFFKSLVQTHNSSDRGIYTFRSILYVTMLILYIYSASIFIQKPYFKVPSFLIPIDRL